MAALVAAAAACDSTQPEPRRLAGLWSGPDSNRLGMATLTLDFTQLGDSVSGSAVMRPVDANDGSCGSCHRFNTGTFSGRLDGTTLTLALTFPLGRPNDPTPLCSVDVQGQLSERVDGSFAGTYTAIDPCEGTLAGVVTLSRK